jgi:organic radical activating enzyme
MVIMTSIRESFRRLFTPPHTLPKGNYNFTAPPNSEVPYRLHLRIDADGNGILIVNASTILHLNQTATEYAYHLVQDHSVEEAAEDVASRYNITRQEALGDYEEFADRIRTLIMVPDLDPVTYLDFDRKTPYTSAKIPYRLDCALTYQLPDGSPRDAAPNDRVSRELSTDEWKYIISKAWDFGIPHIIFTGGEPTLRPDLVELLLECEKNGMVTGVISASLKLGDQEYLDGLLTSGLDHLMILLVPEDPNSWRMLETVLPADLFTAVHLTITPENVAEFKTYIERLAALSPNAVSLSISSHSLDAELQKARNMLAEKGLELVWELPVPYMHQNPVTQEVEDYRVMDGAGKAWLYIEPDGDVLPDQLINQVLGNILTDPWEKILSTRSS